eukprot:5933853-Pleurochrysis_carterae.AAC.2
MVIVNAERSRDELAESEAMRRSESAQFEARRKALQQEMSENVLKLTKQLAQVRAGRSVCALCGE